jgi:hypothetical protein
MCVFRLFLAPLGALGWCFRWWNEMAPPGSRVSLAKGSDFRLDSESPYPLTLCFNPGIEARKIVKRWAE